MANYSLDLKGTNKAEIARTLRAELQKYEGEKLRFPRSFWIGALIGAILMAAADYGDVWMCVGQCQPVAAHKAGADR